MEHWISNSALTKPGIALNSIGRSDKDQSLSKTVIFGIALTERLIH